MRRRSSIGVILLAFLISAPLVLTAQDAGQGGLPPARDSDFELLQNYPNPFNSSTRIPFILGPSLFEDGRQVVVTIRIFNVLQQLVAFPTALNHPEGNGVQVDGLEYPTAGQKEAFWDGYDLEGRQVASGVYYLQLIVNGERRTLKMIASQ